jgi:hypothetical protein
MGPRKPLDEVSLDQLDRAVGGHGGIAVRAPMVPLDYIQRWNYFELCTGSGGSGRRCAAEAGLRTN